jgi:hypothetical protein
MTQGRTIAKSTKYLGHPQVIEVVIAGLTRSGTAGGRRSRADEGTNMERAPPLAIWLGMPD